MSRGFCREQIPMCIVTRMEPIILPHPCRNMTGLFCAVPHILRIWRMPKSMRCGTSTRADRRASISGRRNCFGKWYLYYAGGDKDDIWAIRPYVLECQGDDPVHDPWVEKGKMTRADGDEFSFEAFSLDATVFEVKGSWYYIWAEKVGVGRQISNLYIARMKNGYTLDSVQVLLTTPDYDWERHGFWVNEGPAVIQKDGKVFMTYSASDTGVHYCMGMMTADADADLLDPLSWKKERYPVLTSSEKAGIYGPGHNSFTKDEAGDDIMVYHARTETEIVGNPLYNPNRHAMLMKIRWQDGRPVFGFDE